MVAPLSEQPLGAQRFSHTVPDETNCRAYLAIYEISSYVLETSNSGRKLITSSKPRVCQTFPLEHSAGSDTT
ncbi:hypothetical protein Ssi02_08370 [Sinosporangium siamense]|uniref:Uncharacterized protein n=1 Tax=Sinosporangium siamense TaxID=1367973 RepID=A0A919RAY4_9ACTN|nr:hypothetical protein Ssi02_08370 [Sinosporangium siamense]